MGTTWHTQDFLGNSPIYESNLNFDPVKSYVIDDERVSKFHSNFDFDSCVVMLNHVEPSRIEFMDRAILLN